MSPHLRDDRTPVSSTSADRTRFVISRSEPTAPARRTAVLEVLENGHRFGSQPCVARWRLLRQGVAFAAELHLGLLWSCGSYQFEIVVSSRGSVDCEDGGIRAATGVFVLTVPSTVVHKLPADTPHGGLSQVHGTLLPTQSTALSTGAVLDAADQLVDLLEHDASLAICPGSSRTRMTGRGRPPNSRRSWDSCSR
jgi:hypothetical protein